MITRRDWLRISTSASAALAMKPGLLAALQDGAISTKAIPSSGEEIPVIGLGGRWISNRSTPDELAEHRAVLHELAQGGVGNAKCCFDSAAGYGGGGSESYAGQWASEDGFGDDVFWATKVNVAGRGGGTVDRADVREQIERSFDRMKRDVIDLDQVHNMGDPPTQLRVAQEYKDEGRIRYIGITTTSKRQYDHLEEVMLDDRYSLDFIGIDYAIDNAIDHAIDHPIDHAVEHVIDHATDNEARWWRPTTAAGAPQLHFSCRAARRSEVLLVRAGTGVALHDALGAPPSVGTDRGEGVCALMPYWL